MKLRLIKGEVEALKISLIAGIITVALGLICHAQAAKSVSPDTAKKIDTAEKAVSSAEKAVAADKAKTVPVVSDAIKLRFFKAEFEFQTANEQATQATQAVREKQAALQGVVKELETACGAKYQPSMSQTRDPECIVKPEPPKPETAKK